MIEKIAMAFFDGLLVGLAFVIFIGPVFFTLLHTSLQFGFRYGLAVAVGIVLSDFMAMSMCALGAAAFLQNPKNQTWIALGGAIFLIGLGLKYIFDPKYKPGNQVEVKKISYLSFIMKGFLVNFLNPFVFLVWIGITSMASSKYGIGEGFVVYLAGTLAGIFLTDTLKALFADKIKDFFNPKSLMWVFRFIGIGLIGFGIRLLFLGVLSIPIVTP
ncbi:MAG: LysE family transporter [Bacteroidota bacterium]